MATPLPISREVNVPYDTAIKYVKGSAIALGAVALTVLAPPAAGVVFGVTLGTTAVFILNSAAVVSSVATGWFGFEAVMNFRAGYQALFNERVNGTEREPLIHKVDTSGLEKDLAEAVKAKEELDRKLAAKQKEVDKLNEDMGKLRDEYDKALAKWNETHRLNGEKISCLENDLKIARKEAADLKDQVAKNIAEIDALNKKYDQAVIQNKEKLDLLTKELDEKKVAYKQLESDYNNLRGEVSRIAEEKRRLEKELNTLRDKVSNLEDFADKNTQLEREIHDLKKSMDKPKGTVNPDSAAIEKLKKEKGELESKLKSHALDLSKKSAEMAVLANKIDTLNKDNAEHENRKKSLEDENKDALAKLNAALARVKTLEDQIDKHNPLQLAREHAKALREKDAQISTLKTEIDDLKETHERSLKTKVQVVAQQSQIEIDSLNRKLKRLEDEVAQDKKKLTGDISRLEKELEEEKKGLRIVQDSHTQEKINLETGLNAQIDAKHAEIEALRKSIDSIKEEQEKMAREKEAQLLLKIQNTKAEFVQLQTELSQYHEKISEMSVNAREHENVKEELSLSKKRINDFIKEQERLRETNRQLKEAKENGIEILEVRMRLEEALRFNEDYQHELRGKESRVHALEKRVGELETELAALKGQTIESAPSLIKTASRWSIRKKELEWEAAQPKEVVNAGQDSKENTYKVIPNHRLTYDAVLTKFKKGENCDDYELIQLFENFQLNYREQCEKDKKARADAVSKNESVESAIFRAKQYLRNFITDLAGNQAVGTDTLMHKNVHQFLKIGIFFLESNTLKDIFDYIRSFSTIKTLNTLLEGYMLRFQNGKGIAHDTMLEAVVAYYTDLCEKNLVEAKKQDHTLFIDAVFYLINKNSDIVTKNLTNMDRLGLLSNATVASLYERCLSHFQHPDTNSLCIFLKSKLTPTLTSATS